MRTLMGARVIVLDSDAARRDALCRSLMDLGIFGVSGIATVAEALGQGAAQPDVFIIQGPVLSANDDGVEISANPLAARGIATILLLPGATMLLRRKAARAGYSIVIGAPASPRLLYRRIAHSLQNARRAKRREQKIQEQATAKAQAQAEPEVTLVADPTPA